MNNDDKQELEFYLKKIDECVGDALLLQGKALSLEEEKEQVTLRVQNAKIWLKRQPEYLKFLEHLQNIFHQENIQVFSELLTYFVKDVLNKDKEIVFDLYTYHNLPALKIEAQQNGFKEDIYAGNGGSIVNIVSTGLRLIALSRMENRKFIVLDEPDCWLKPDHVPFFAKIIGEISAELGIQTIIVSHHQWEYFKDYGRVIELSKQGQYLEANIIHDTAISYTEEELAQLDLIKKIRLVRFMSHYDTVFELHPHLTCIIGENDIGKSVLSTALRAVSYNDSSDSFIRHNETEAQVYIELSQDRSILWQRFLKTTQENPQKVKYSLFLDGITSTPANHEFNSNTTPDFIVKELKICTTEEIDVHINNQKQPVFLLSSDTRPQQRAKILSLGKESLYIQKIMEKIKTKTKNYKQDEKQGEIRFAQINNTLLVLEDIENLVNESKDLQSNFREIIKKLDDVYSSIEFLQEWFRNEELIKVGTIDEVTTPTLENTEEHKLILNNLKLNQAILSVGIVDIDVQEPNIVDTTKHREVSLNFKKAIEISSVGLVDTDIIVPEIKDTKSIKELSHSLKEASLLQNVGKIDVAIEVPQIVDQTQAKMGLKNWMNLTQISSIGLVDTNISIPELINTDDIKKMSLEWKQSLKTIEDGKKDYQKAMALVKESEEKIDQFFNNKENFCPTCKQPLSKEHLHI